MLSSAKLQRKNWMFIAVVCFCNIRNQSQRINFVLINMPILLTKYSLVNCASDAINRKYCVSAKYTIYGVLKQSNVFTIRCANLFTTTENKIVHIAISIITYIVNGNMERIEYKFGMRRNKTASHTLWYPRQLNQRPFRMFPYWRRNQTSVGSRFWACSPATRKKNVCVEFYGSRNVKLIYHKTDKKQCLSFDDVRRAPENTSTVCVNASIRPIYLLNKHIRSDRCVWITFETQRGMIHGYRVEACHKCLH